MIIPKEEAIRTLRKVKSEVMRGTYMDKVYEMAIEALKDRPKGEWIDEDGTYYANCSNCGYQMDTHAERGYFAFCPNCGADMRGANDE